jgi:hypothetical protein
MLFVIFAKKDMMEVRFYLDPETEQPHLLEHGVTEEEVFEVLVGRGDDFRAKGKSRIKFGQTLAGRYLKVIYVPDDDGEGILVVTAYDLRGKALKAFRRRQRKRT